MSIFNSDELCDIGSGAGKEITSLSETENETKSKTKSKFNYFTTSSDDDEDDCDCLICGDKFIRDDKDKMNDYIKLKCGHEFHYTCINNYFKVINTKNSYNVLSTNLKRECPMCRLSSPLIQIKMNFDYVKGIHRAPRKINNNKKSDGIAISSVSCQCKGICKTGKQCKKKGLDKYHGFCHIHMDQYKE